MRYAKFYAIAALILVVVATDLHAGGPWAQKSGKTRIGTGFSRKTAGSRWIDGRVDTPADSTLVDGLFHDFQYAYLNLEIGIAEHLELSTTINYLWGYERATTDPNTGKYIGPYWELNQGFTDSWLNLKYQFLEGDIPMAAMVSTRFPDLYDEPGHVYTRYATRKYNALLDTVSADGHDTVLRVQRNSIEPTAEWRGLLKRDFGIHLLAGHSFGADGYVQTQLAYNFREGAYADQIIFAIDGGYNIPVGSGWVVTPKATFDYTGGLGNGGLPDESDRFQFRDGQGQPLRNNYFNNGRYARLYGGIGVGLNETYGLEIGAGRWLFGNGSAIYWETYAQLSWAL